MFIFKLLAGIHSVGHLFTLVGKLLLSAESAVRESNLDSRAVLPEGQPPHVTGSSNTKGMENEKPDEVQGSFNFEELVEDDKFPKEVR